MSSEWGKKLKKITGNDKNGAQSFYHRTKDELSVSVSHNTVIEIV